jgi:hypothetical protein
VPWEEATLVEFSSSGLSVEEFFAVGPASQAEKRQARVNTIQLEPVKKEYFEITQGA